MYFITSEFIPPLAIFESQIDTPPFFYIKYHSFRYCVLLHVSRAPVPSATAPFALHFVGPQARAETSTWPSRVVPRTGRLIVLWSRLFRIGRFQVIYKADVYLESALCSRTRTRYPVLLSPSPPYFATLPLADLNAHHRPLSTTMGSLLGKVKLFAFVQCAVFLVFVLEVADRLMY